MSTQVFYAQPTPIVNHVPYIPSALRSGLGFLSAYGIATAAPVQPTPTMPTLSPEMAAQFVDMGRKHLRAEGKVFVAGHYRGGRWIAQHVRKSPGLVPMSDEAVEAMVGRYDEYGSGLV